MFDQADKLRQLVRDTVQENTALAPGVPLIVVSGAQARVGASTVAIRLAEELVQLGKRVVLVDGNLLHPTIAAELDVDSRQGIDDVLSGSRSVCEVLEPVSVGFWLLSGSTSDEVPDTNIRALRRLLTELRAVHQSDLIVLDAGAGMSPWVERMWTAAMQILLVTTTNAMAIRDAYTAVKMAPWGDVDGKLRLVVNRCDDLETAMRVGQGFASTCRQFLGMKLVGSASQIANEAAMSFRSTVRLLAADALSHSCAFSQRIHVPKSAVPAPAHMDLVRGAAQ